MADDRMVKKKAQTCEGSRLKILIFSTVLGFAAYNTIFSDIRKGPPGLVAANQHLQSFVEQDGALSTNVSLLRRDDQCKQALGVGRYTQMCSPSALTNTLCCKHIIQTPDIYLDRVDPTGMLRSEQSYCTTQLLCDPGLWLLLHGVSPLPYG